MEARKTVFLQPLGVGWRKELHNSVLLIEELDKLFESDGRNHSPLAIEPKSLYSPYAETVNRNNMELIPQLLVRT